MAIYMVFNGGIYNGDQDTTRRENYMSNYMAIICCLLGVNAAE